MSRVTFFCIFISLSGCSGISKGITEAIIEKHDQEDDRQCEVWGEKFSGINHSLTKPDHKMKVMMVHGVGNHIPGYSTQFLEKLTQELGLTVTAKSPKNIKLIHPKHPDKSVGNLRVNRYLDSTKNRELMFYELTWSEISQPEKSILSYDNSGEQSFRRAEVNDLLKKFSNDTGPDPIIYLGEKREDILVSFAQSFCWMISRDWTDLQDDVQQVCDSRQFVSADHDSYAFVSHSLGSRIVIDGLQRIASILANGDTSAQLTSVSGFLKTKQLPIYMMSNQLPMLQLGRLMPEVTNQKANYCSESGKKYGERFVAATNIYAFSDPNDLLSYAIPHDYLNKYLDSRLCADVTNIHINVAKVYDVFGMGKMANPLEAHIGYQTDDRVIALIAKGIGNAASSPIVHDRCRLIEMVD